ncbi:Protein disulfide isomerase [Seminavis robusta]|uniref:Protein disulfide isomerase n=1 Tax=Seminavis robusta TaxID=568900 RepID=A0A9N8E631_9STRA|nr:Protein disulfide isomerase [Seminavis robusta]|eukprot:Sro582_g170420.1 Protein disulfide isomerase (489) ;mRNA; f:8418-9884
MKQLSLLLFTLLCLSCITSSTNASVVGVTTVPEDGYVEGQKVKKLVTLSEVSFRRARHDTANPIFLYMFGAYWCGHCKRLTPILEATAPQVAGRIAIGKIDCTDDKRLCEEFGVRGYPTLKYSLDGILYDYTGGRSEEDFVAFAERLSRPVMTIVDSVEQANKFTQDQTYGHGVSFVCHDPRKTVAAPASTLTVEQLAATSPIYKVCKQAARKELAHAHFSALTARIDTSAITGVPSSVVADDTDSGATQDLDAPPPTPLQKGGFVCRLEAHVPSRCLLEQHTMIDVESVLEFVKRNNVATLTEFGPHNFHRIGRLGRPLVIGVVDKRQEEIMGRIQKELESFAINGPARLTNEKYYFGWMDGVRWANFLEQFDVQQTELPQAFVLDVPRRLYWQDSYYREKTLQAFLTAIDDGYIRPKESRGVRGAGLFGWIFSGWTLLLLLIGAAGAVVVLSPDAQGLLGGGGKKKKKDGGGSQGGHDALLGKKNQ